MKRSKFSDEQILAIVNEDEAGRKLADLCRTYGISMHERRVASPPQKGSQPASNSVHQIQHKSLSRMRAYSTGQRQSA
jgi:hypothetical protein